MEFLEYARLIHSVVAQLRKHHNFTFTVKFDHCNISKYFYFNL